MKKGLFAEVYKITQKTPRGKVVTYGDIAKQIQKSKIGNKEKSFFKIDARIVGWALHANPDPESIPCHRVVDRWGHLATGYVFGGQKGQRRKLLSEGVEFKDKTHVNLLSSLYHGEL